MGEYTYAKRLDDYLEGFERQLGFKLEIPEKLMTRKLVNQSIEMKEKSKRDERNMNEIYLNLGIDPTSVGDGKCQKKIPSYLSMSLPELPSPLGHPQVIPSHSRGSCLIEDDESELEIDNFDLDRIDDRLRTLGINPELIETDEENDSNLRNGNNTN